MNTRMLFILFAPFIMACFAGCYTPDLEEKIGPRPEPITQVPLITLNSITPNPIKEGDRITIIFSADQDLDSCSASVSGQVATCRDPSGSNCSCTFDITVAILEGSAAVTVSGTNANGTGNANGIVQVDKTPPIVTGNLLTIVRHAMGVDDGVSANANAATDNDGDLYSGRGITTVRIWNASSGGSEVLTVTTPELQGDSSFVEQALAGADTDSPPQLWASAVDVPGNEGARVEIVNGKDVEPPVVDGAKLTINRRDLTARDGILRSGIRYHLHRLRSEAS